MQVTRQKFLFSVDRKMRGTESYGTCPKCSKTHEKFDLIFSKRGERYCSDCYVLCFKGSMEEIIA